MESSIFSWEAATLWLRLHFLETLSGRASRDGSQPPPSAWRQTTVLMRLLKAALIYFAIVFGAGFVLGPIRILLLVPRFGVRTAELIEMPFMLLVMIVASRWIVRRFAQDSSVLSRLILGFVALILMISTELWMARILQGVSISQYIAARDPVSGTAYYGMLILFALLPAFVQMDR